ncbi:2-amino-4-hydroxy-6-hydroxymethyldihydropteridine diphosphokinase [Desulfobacterota bacterium M19]
MALAFIALGSNLGDGRANLLKAWQELKGGGITPLALSSPYKTAPVGMTSSSWFTNAVGMVETTKTPASLLNTLLELETEMGRNRARGMDRIIDLDILYYNDLVCHDRDLDLPHPEIENRLFVLAPLAELAPDHRHPANGLSSRQMLRRLESRNHDQQIKKTTWK